MASLLPVIAVLATVAAVVALGWILFGGQLFGQNSNEAVDGEQTASATGAANPSQEATSAAPSTTQPAPVADRTTGVTVLNSTQTSGLARRAVTALQSDGWTNSEFSYDFAQLRSTTVVYYADAEQETTAQALVDDLGVGEAEVSDQAADGLLVVLGTDYVS
jgi:hypothetical protein